MMRLLAGVFAVLLVACAAAFEGPGPFAADQQWVFADSLQDVSGLKLAGTDAEAQAEIDRAMARLASRGREVSVLVSHKPRSATRIPRWIMGSDREVTGLYEISGDGPARCLANLLDTSAEDLGGGGSGTGGELARNGSNREELFAGGTEGGEPEGGEPEGGEPEGGEPAGDEAPELEPDREERPEIIRGEDSKDQMRCGSLASIHSLIKLGWIKEADAVVEKPDPKDPSKKRKSLKPELVKSFDKHIGDKGMNPPGEKAAHQEHAPEGGTVEEKLDVNLHADPATFGIGGELGKKSSPKKREELRKEQVAELKKVIAALGAKHDCHLSLIVQLEGGRKFGHVEMIKKVQLSEDGKNVTIETADGLSQGDPGAENIPFPPANHEWKFKLPLELTDGPRRTGQTLDIRCYGLAPRPGD